MENRTGKAKKIFILIFLVCFISEIAIISRFSMIDLGIWAKEAQYLAQGDTKAFDFYAGYGHPGGPLIWSGLFGHKLLDFSYLESLKYGLVLLDSIVIALIAVLCFVLRPKTLWWLAAGILLSFQALLIDSTPPSFLASCLIVLLALSSLWIYENNPKSDWPVIIWGLIGGAAAATRLDVSGVFLAGLGLLLLSKIGFKKFLPAVAAAFLAFSFFDPFMWFMPVEHISDLANKMLIHYAEFRIEHLKAAQVLLISPLAVLAILFALSDFFKKKRTYPAGFTTAILIITAVLSTVYLSADFQNERYFFPLAILWEALLPLYVFNLIDLMDWSFLRRPESKAKARKMASVAVLGLFLLYPLSILYANLINQPDYFRPDFYKMPPQDLRNVCYGLPK